MSALRMGLLDVLTLPVSLPLKGAWVAIEEAVTLSQEKYEEAERLPGDLADLQAAYEMGEITEEEYLQAVASLKTREPKVEGGQDGDARGGASEVGRDAGGPD